MARLADPLSQPIPQARKGLCFGRVYYPLNSAKQPSHNVAYNNMDRSSARVPNGQTLNKSAVKVKTQFE